MQFFLATTYFFNLAQLFLTQRLSSQFLSASLLCYVCVAFQNLCFLVVVLNSVGLVSELGLVFFFYMNHLWHYKQFIFLLIFSLLAVGCNFVDFSTQLFVSYEFPVFVLKIDKTLALCFRMLNINVITFLKNLNNFDHEKSLFLHF